MACKQQTEPLTGYIRQLCHCGVVFYRHERSRQRMCCLCKQTTITVRSKLLPSTTGFKTAAEVDEYLGGDTIKCLLCGGPFQILGRHLISEHGISGREYKLRFGIPLTRPLSVSVVRDRARIRIQGLIASGAIQTSADEDRARLLASKPRAYVAPTAPSAIAAMNHGVKANPSHKLIDTFCSVCGKPAGQRKESVVLIHGCRILCPTCKIVRHKESESKWLRSIGFTSKSEYQAALYQRKKKRREEK